LHSCADMRELIEMLFGAMSGVGGGWVYDGVHVLQGEVAVLGLGSAVL